jgi:DNA polymerase I
MQSKYIIVDGSSLIHRAFYALPTMTTSSGYFTNAIFGFTNMIIKLVADLKPAGVVVAFDKGKHTFRNDDYSEYKAQRKPTPSELSEQFPAAREVLDALGITVLELAGFEADDIMGTLAAQATADQEFLIVTGDRDALQLVNEYVHVLLTKKGISEFEEVDPIAMTFNYGFTPAQVIEMKGLMGDTSDNIPGIPGVGEKTAKKLIADFGSIDGVYENIDKVSGEKLKEKILANRDMAYLSKKLATIVCTVPVPTDMAQYAIKPDMEKVRAVAEKYEFRALPTKLSGWFSTEANTTIPAETVDYGADVERISTSEAFDKLLEVVRKQGALYFWTGTTGRVPDCRFTGAFVFALDRKFQVTLESPAWTRFLALLSDPLVPKITHDAKPVYNVCQAEGRQFTPLLFDTMVAGYLINPSGSDYQFDRLLTEFLGKAAGPFDKKQYGSDEYASWLVGNLPELHLAQQKEIDRMGAADLLKAIELPLIEALSFMEVSGIQVDRRSLDRMESDIAIRIQTLLGEIYSLSGESFNVNSTKQLGTVLFEKLGLPVGKKNKTGYSTDAEVLENLAGAHPVVDRLLEYRMLTKLKSTYLDGMRPLIRPETGRIHTHFNQTVTSTGRLSSSDPNLQNIPVRTELGRQIRTLFVPGDSFDWLLSADYSQIELRILAHLSGDENMIHSFLTDEDIHTRTASEVFGVPIDQVSAEMRFRAKAVNFGIVYGISDYGLSQGINVSRKEAGEYITGYFARYPAVKAFIDSAVLEARMNGYVSTLFGRRRYLPDINSSNFNLRAFAERTAMNTPVQGTAADIIKKAMIQVNLSLREQGLKSRVLLQVHDELVLEVTNSEMEKVKSIVKSAMENAVTLSVPLSVEIKQGLTWAETK